MLLSSSQSRRASPSRQLLSRLDMQGEARKQYTPSLLNNQKNSNRRKSSKEHRLLVLAPILHSSKEKNFFTELGFGLTMKKMTTYCCRKGLVNPSAISFTVWRKLNSFKLISCFMDKTCNTSIKAGNCPPPFGLELVEMVFALDKSYLRSNQSFSFTFLPTFSFLK